MPTKYRCPQTFGRYVDLPKELARKHISALLDQPGTTWLAKRVDDDLNIEEETFTTLRAATEWLLLHNDAIYNAGVDFIEAVILAYNLILLVDIGPCEVVEVPMLWQSLQAFKPCARVM